MSLTINISSLSSTSITARVTTSGLVAMEHHWFLDGIEYKVQYTSKGTTSSSCTFTGLSPGTSYRITVRVSQVDPWKLLDTGSKTVTTNDSGGGSGSGDSGDDTKKRPNNWYWDSNISKGRALRLPAREWNRFIDRIEEFADYKGETLNSRYLSRAIASSGGTMLASQGNAAVYLIDQLDTPVSAPYTVSPGDTIRASFFLGLSRALNSIQ